MLFLYVPFFHFFAPLPELLTPFTVPGALVSAVGGVWGMPFSRPSYLTLVSRDCNDWIANDYSGSRAPVPTEELVALELEGAGGFFHRATVECLLLQY